MVEYPCTITINIHFHNHNMSDNIPLSKYKYLTDVQVMQCLTLTKTSWKIRKIADEVGCSKSTVGRVLQDHDYKTFTVHPKSSGHPCKTTEHEDRLIVHTAKANHRLPFKDITN